ncbi:MAG: hypothetical protein ACM3WQ_00760 [Chloroflexota bacterium]
MSDELIRNGEPYIHLNWHDSIVNNANYGSADIKSIYMKYARDKRAGLRKALGMTASEAGKLTSQITGLYDTIQNRGDQLSKSLLNTGMSAARAAKASNPNAMKNLSNKIVNDTKWLQKTIDSMQDILDQSDGFNQELIKFFTEKAINPTSLATKNVNVADLKLMDLEKKTGTSLANLKKSLEALDNATQQYQLPLESQFVGDIDKVLSSGEAGNKSVGSIIRAAGQRILNTQGFYLEGVMWGLFEGAIKDDLIPGLQGKDIQVDLVGGKGDKTDLSLINFAKNNKTFNIGFSMKATEKGVTKKNYYATSPLYRYYEMSHMLNTQEEATFDNLIAQGRTRLQAAQTLNKLIAARASWEAVTGAQGDEVYFFVYLNKIVSADEMFSNMASGGENGFKLSFDQSVPNLSSIPSLNQRAITAYVRSHKMLDTIRHIRNVQIITKI